MLLSRGLTLFFVAFSTPTLDGNIGGEMRVALLVLTSLIFGNAVAMASVSASPQNMEVAACASDVTYSWNNGGMGEGKSLADLILNYCSGPLAELESTDPTWSALDQELILSAVKQNDIADGNLRSFFFAKAPGRVLNDYGHGFLRDQDTARAILGRLLDSAGF